MARFLKGPPRKPSEKKKRNSKRVAPLGSGQTSLAPANCWEAQMRDFNDLGYGNDIDPPEPAMISAQEACSGVKSDMGTEATEYVTAHNPKLDVSRILAAVNHDGEIDEVALGKDLERVRVWFKNKDELSPPRGLINRHKNYAMNLSKVAGHLLQLMDDDRLGDAHEPASSQPLDGGKIEERQGGLREAKTELIDEDVPPEQEHPGIASEMLLGVRSQSFLETVRTLAVMLANGLHFPPIC